MRQSKFVFVFLGIFVLGFVFRLEANSEGNPSRIQRISSKCRQVISSMTAANGAASNRAQNLMVRTKLVAVKAGTGLRRIAGHTSQTARLALKTDTEIIAEVRGFEDDTAQSFWDSFDEAFNWIRQFRTYPETMALYDSAIQTTKENISSLEWAVSKLTQDPRKGVIVRLHPKSSTRRNRTEVAGIAIEGGNHGPKETKTITRRVIAHSLLMKERIQLANYEYAKGSEMMAQAVRFARLKDLRRDFEGSSLSLSDRAKQITFADAVRDPSILRVLSVDEARHWIALRIGSLLNEEGRIIFKLGKRWRQGKSPLQPDAGRVELVTRLRGVASFFSDTSARFFTVWPLKFFIWFWGRLRAAKDWLDNQGKPLLIPSAILAFMLVVNQTKELQQKITTDPKEQKMLLMWAEIRRLAHSANNEDVLADKLSVIIENTYSNSAYRIAIQVLKGTRNNFSYDPTFLGKDGKPVEKWVFESAEKDVFPILNAVYNGTERAPDGEPIYGVNGSMESRKEAVDEIREVFKKKKP